MNINVENGVRASALDQVLSAQDTDTLILNTANGTKKITKAELLRKLAPNDYMNIGRDLTVVFASEIASYSDEWAWIQARLDAHNLDDLFEGDYIPVTMTTGEIIEMQIAGTNTYLNIFSGAVHPHIDWISRDSLATTHVWNTTNNNNGDSTEAQPFMASALYKWLNTAVSGDSTSNILSKLPQKVRNVIAPKRLYMPTRYTNGSNLTDDNSWADKSFTSLWLPFEGEIFEHCSWSTRGYGTAAMRQYGLFKSSWKAVMKRNGRGGSFGHWWTASAYSGNATYSVRVYASGISSGNSASNTHGVPVCFRTMAAA